MPRKRKRTPSARRRATTRSGQEIVEAILDAADELLASGGYAALTTNHLAARAGVSIGSLYHYFPNKEAIIAKLAVRMEERAARLLSTRRRELPEDIGKEQLVRSLSTTLVARELGATATRRALLLDVPRRWVEPAMRAREAHVHTLLSTLLATRETVRPGDKALMAFVLAHAVRGVIEGALMYHPELLERPALVDELFELVARYTASGGDGLAGRKTSEQTDEQTDEQTNARTDAQTDARTDARSDDKSNE